MLGFGILGYLMRKLGLIRPLFVWLSFWDPCWKWAMAVVLASVPGEFYDLFFQADFRGLHGHCRCAAVDEASAFHQAAAKADRINHYQKGVKN